MRGAYSVTRWEGNSNERRGMGACANGVKCSLVELVKRNMLM